MNEYLQEYSARPKVIQEDSRKYAQKLQRYIYTHHLQCTDTEELADWNNVNWYVSLKIYKDSNVYFDSFLHYANWTNADAHVLTEKIGWDSTSRPYFAYPIHFEDEDGVVILSGCYFFQHKQMISFVSFFVFVFSFVICFLFLCHRRFIYIEEIRKGLEEIHMGDSMYEIPLVGNDELTSLAAYINAMSRSLQKQMEMDEETREKNREIVAAISHDIRTPLTSVICYLDLLKDCRYENKEAMDRYVQNASMRAYQIKGMTDELFERAVKKNQKNKANWEVLNGNELLSQVISEMLYTLRENKFHPEFSFDFKQSFEMRVNVIAFRRIFDNICSNILKYADKTLPVLLTTEIYEGRLVIIEKNVKSASKFIQSTGIGLGSCKKLVRQHKGELQLKNDGYYFEVRIYLPIVIN